MHPIDRERMEINMEIKVNREILKKAILACYQKHNSKKEDKCPCEFDDECSKLYKSLPNDRR